MDHSLVERAQQGDEIAFTSLVKEVGDRLYSTAYHILGDASRAEDATQQALISMWRHLPQLRELERFEGWAYRTVVREAYAEAKRHRRWLSKLVRVPEQPIDVAGGSDTPSIGDRDEMERGLAKISPDHRAVLVLKFYLDLGDDAIAAMLGVPVGTVRSRLFYAMRHLRAALEADARSADSRVSA